jgi:hypothetical protein
MKGQKNYLSLTVGTNKLKCFSPGIIDQVASNESSLLLKIQKSNKRTLQLFTQIIKMENYKQKYLKCQAEMLGHRVQMVRLK